jgi:3-dehydroquinate synthase
MDTVQVSLGPRSYDIVITATGTGFGQFARDRARSSERAFVVCDEHVESWAEGLGADLEASGFQVSRVVIPAGEASKSLETAAIVYDHLAEIEADRRTLIVAVGGGVVGDLAGFVAATYNRGLPLLMVPTSLLAMVDSSVGGKVGINLRVGKNLVGSFHQPVGVWIHTTTLETLPEREYLSGLAEVVKYGVILDAAFFQWLEEHHADMRRRDAAAIRHVIARSCRLKADVVEQDEREETGLRMILNYGHTFAHAFETYAGYGTWLHGEAVAAGMICASRLAERLGMIGNDVTERQIDLLRALNLPTAPNPWPTDDLLAIMRRDKKNRGGRLRFVLPKRLGEVVVIDQVDETLVREVLQSFQGL